MRRLPGFTSNAFMHCDDCDPEETRFVSLHAGS
jgi:hypothetical protein